MGFLDNIPFFRRSQAEATAEVEPQVVDAPVPSAPGAIAPAQAAPAVASEPVVEPDPAPSPRARAEAEELVRAVVRELPDFVTVAVVERQGGRILAGQWAGHSGGAVEAAAANAEIINQTYLMLEALQVEADEQLRDVVITLTRQLHLLQVFPQQSWLLYLAVKSQNINLALARTVLQEFVK